MRYYIKILILTLCIVQGSCVPLFVGLMVTSGTMVAIQDRSIGNTIDDTTILIKINKNLLKAGLFSQINVKVSEGRVLLIGNVNTHTKRLEAEKIAWQQKGVKEVINEINIKIDNKAISNIKHASIDGLISAQLKARIIAESNIRSVNYSVNTINRVVYLMGIAQDKEELNHVISIARTIKNVKQVVSYVRFKNSKLRN